MTDTQTALPAAVSTPLAADAPEAEVSTIEPSDVVLFGLDGSGKAHASRFSLEDADLARMAAGLMGMQVLPLTTDEQRAAAKGLPQGRVFASGRAFVPFVKAAVYERLKALAGYSVPAPTPKRVSRRAAAAAHSDEKRVSEAREAGKAEVAASQDDLAERVETTEQAEAGDATKVVSTPSKADRPTWPDGWEMVAVGSLVLAPDTDRESWWPTVVVGARDDGRWILKWRDFPEQRSFVRKHTELALPHPQTKLR
jgi:hypothetical protein